MLRLVAEGLVGEDPYAHLNDPGVVVKVEGALDDPEAWDVGFKSLDGEHPGEWLFGFVAPAEWLAIGIAVGGWAAPADGETEADFARNRRRSRPSAHPDAVRVRTISLM